MKNFENIRITQKKDFPVSVFKESPIKPEIVTGDSGLENKVKNKHLNRPQLALAGYVDFFNNISIQIFGNTEMFYLESLDEKTRLESINRIAQFDIPCIIVTNNHKLDDSIIDIFKENNIAVLYTQYETTKALAFLSEFLDDQLVQQTTLHGSFVDVYGVGILFTGKSGIGKSEITLDLVERGHRLVADDIVLLNKKGETTLMGTGTSLVQHFMEIRGLGIIDVRQMFGVRSIRFQKRLEIIVELEDWSDKEDYDRTGLDQVPADILGVEITSVKLPIFPGKNITVIAEVIVLNYLLKTYGYDAAKVLDKKTEEKISQKSKIIDDRIINYFQGDLE